MIEDACTQSGLSPWGQSIGVLIFTLYKLYVLFPKPKHHKKFTFLDEKIIDLYNLQVGVGVSLHRDINTRPHAHTHIN